jgi:nuclear transport factor 2 (NTF2) superfamily protein
MDVRTWIKTYAEAWRERDAHAAAALFTEDAVYRSSVFSQPHVGTDRIREYWEGATATQTEHDLRMGAPIVEGDRVAVEWWMVMRDDGEWVTLPGCLLLRFAADGRCEELREYWHVEPGRHEPPSGWGT